MSEFVSLPKLPTQRKTQTPHWPRTPHSGLNHIPCLPGHPPQRCGEPLGGLTAAIAPLRVVSSWIERRKVQSEKANLTILFDKYLPTCLDKLRIGFKRITPVPEITVIQTILYLLECLLTEKNAPPDSPKELYELYFVFACFWAFGGAMFQDQVTGAPGTCHTDQATLQLS